MKNTTPLVAAVLLCAGAITVQAQEKGWEFEVVPYGWFCGFRGDVTVQGNDTHFVAELEDLFKNLEFAGSLEAVARNQNVVLVGSMDYFILNSDVEVGPAATPGTLETTESLGLIAIGYPMRVSEKVNTDFLLGFQALRMDNDLTSSAGNGSSSINVYDPLILLRIRAQLAKKLYLYAPLAVGGYAGDSDLVYDAQLQFQYLFTKNVDARLGYRIVGYDFYENDWDNLDFYQAGWTLGIGIRF